MGWLSKLSRNTTTTSADKGEYYEKDNVGTRLVSADQAGAYRLTAKMEEPCIDYCFKSVSDACSAMLEIPCIKVARDTKNLISTEILQFGVFKRYTNVDDAFIASLSGNNLTRDLWSAAKRAFEFHGGKRVVEVEPSETATKSEKETGRPSAVKFSHEENRIVSGFPATYRYYNAPDKASAIVFLQKNPVKRPSFFLAVNTPEGIFCRDIQGFFEQ